METHSQVLRYGVVGALVLGIALPTVGAENKFDVLQSSVDTVEGKVDGVQTSVDGVQSSVNTVEGKVDGVQTSVDAVQTSVGTVEGKVDGVQTSVNTVDGKVSSVQGAVGTVQTSVDNVETLIMDLQDSVDMLNIESGFTFPGDGLTGAPLQYQDNGDETFLDLNTGLTWEMKVAGGGTCAVALHAVNAQCTWAQATGDWINAINAEGGTGFAGHSDWRVPTVKELQSLIDHSVFDPAVSAGFPGSVATPSCWSSTPDANNASVAWNINFFRGVVNTNLKTNLIRVRAVRGGS